MSKSVKPVRLADRVQNVLILAALGTAMALPYRTRVRSMGWLMSRVIAPLAGYRRRIRDNLAHVRPDMSQTEVERLVRAVPDNMGRTIIEIYSGREFLEQAAGFTVTGPGLEALQRAKDEARPVIMISGHFGNYDAVRSLVTQRGFNVGSLYRPMNNALFNVHYVKAMESVAEPMFSRGRRGLAQMLKYLRDGNTVAMLWDQYVTGAPLIDFLGKPAPTALSVAEMALKYDAELIPAYGIRQADGLSFCVEIEAPIPHSDALTMMQAVSDSLAAQIEKHPEQWLWVHRRWKPERRAGK